MISVDIIADEKGFCALEPEWNQLHAKIHGHPQADFAWAWCWWDEIGRRYGWTPHIAVCRDEGQVVGILLHAVIRKHGLKILLPWGEGVGPIGEGLFKDEKYIQSTWDGVLNSRLYCFGIVRRIYESNPSRNYLHKNAGLIARHENNIIDVSLIPPEGWRKTLSKSFQRQMRRAEDSLRKQGVVQVVHYEKTSVPHEVIEEMINNKYEWTKRKALSGVFDYPQACACIIRQLQSAVEKNHCIVHVVSCGGHRVAHESFLQHSKSRMAFIGSYDPAWDKLSPGTYLLGQTCEWAIEKGYNTIDFMQGAEPYKKKVSNSLRWIEEYWFAPTFLGKVLAKAYLSFQKAKGYGSH